jgi:hypothetical protein
MRFFKEFVVSQTARFFAEPVLRLTTRFFAALRMTCEGLRMTGGEGFRMTNLHFKAITTQPPSRGMTEYMIYTPMQSIEEFFD